MSDQDYEKLEGLLVKALQAGKKETSDLADSIIKKQDVHIQNGIEKYVNGHLREIKSHLGKQDETIEKQNHKLEEIHDEQLRVATELSKLKKDTKPTVDATRVVVSFGKFTLWAGGIIIVIWQVLKIFQ